MITDRSLLMVGISNSGLSTASGRIQAKRALCDQWGKSFYFSQSHNAPVVTGPRCEI
jgi:hypothetical protein